jgi:hypothetical protein
LQDEAIKVERDCGAYRCGFTSQKEESGQQRCEVTDVEVYFLNRFKFRYDEGENLEVASLESCHLGIGLNLTLTMRVDIEGVSREGVNRVTRNSAIDLVWLRSAVFLALGRQKKM